MGRETNILLLRALEEQIEDGKGDIIQLKRDRNSLLNISTRVPPEILGPIFAWSLVRPEDAGDFGGLQQGSYNFLLVCHHWFEVASRTPEIWSFWGNTLRDWKKCHHHPGAAPIDLVLDGDKPNPSVLFDKSLRDAVRSRAIQGSIRQVHLRSGNSGTLTPIISLLTPDNEGGQNDNIESIVWHNMRHPSADVSDFFARSRLSRLRSLDLFGDFRISSWDCLAPRTTLLTTLSLRIMTSLPSPTPTASQLCSVLASNPNIRKLRLHDAALPKDAGRSTPKVQLRNLKTLSLMGKFRGIFGLLHHLILPEALDEIDLDLFGSTTEDISQTLGPYIRDHFRRDARFQDRLWMYSTSFSTAASISIGVIRTRTIMSRRVLPQVSLLVHAEQALTNLIPFLPLEHIVSFFAGHGTKLPEELLSMMPNIAALSISEVKLSEGFLQPNPNGPYANTKLLPSLRTLRLEHVLLTGDDDWGHLTTYLAHQTSDNQAISLQMIGDFPHVCPEVVERIKDLVEKFTYGSKA